MTKQTRPSTRVIHAGEGQDPNATPLIAPVYQTSTFLFPSTEELCRYQAGQSDLYLYSRYGNPTITTAETKLAVLEDAEAALVFSSGMAAVSTTILGARVGGRRGRVLWRDLRQHDGVPHAGGVTPRHPRAIPLARGDPRPVAGPVAGRPGCSGSRSPINPTLRCVDIARVAAACRARGVLSVIDSTFASPANQQPLSPGRRSRDAQRDEVPRRAQRHHGRRGGRSRGADRSAAPHAASAGHGARSRSRPGCWRAA